ncbi:MAG: 16S rRNA (guanine(527)-N(7))-methyltransferase RsmG [Brevirhabdus sp.]
MSRADAVLDVSRETQERLETYINLLRKWNPAINLVSRSTLEEAWTRHIVDSAQLMELAPVGADWADLGSGGGFPGMVCAIIGAETRPETRFMLVESDQRKSTFLRNVSRETGVKVDVIAKRIESVDPLRADILSARALAPLDRLLQFAERHLSKNGTCLFPKGENWRREVDEALERWAFESVETSSRTDPDSMILSIKDIARV